MHKRNPARFFFLLPGVLWVLAFTLYPLFYSLRLSFYERRLGRSGKYVGLDNYRDIISNIGQSRVGETIDATIFIIVGSVVITLTAGLFIAWLFNHDLPGLRYFRSLLTMPLFTAPIAVGFLGIAVFNEQSGPINQVVSGLGGDVIPWFTNIRWARIAVVIADSWQWTPFVFIVVLAAMQSIPDELYEAARLDTSSEWTLFRRVTFPLIQPAVGTVAILRLVETFKILDIPLVLTGGGPGNATQTYSYFIYITGLKNFNLGYASALAYLLVILAIIITSIYFWRVRERFG
jgi:multiple sugar transport system permease protein